MVDINSFLQKKIPHLKWLKWMCRLLDWLVVWYLDLLALDILLHRPTVLSHQCKNPFPISISFNKVFMFILQVLPKMKSGFVGRNHHENT